MLKIVTLKDTYLKIDRIILFMLITIQTLKNISIFIIICQNTRKNFLKEMKSSRDYTVGLDLIGQGEKRFLILVKNLLFLTEQNITDSHMITSNTLMTVVIYGLLF